VYGLPLAEWSEQIIGVPALVTPVAPTGEQNEPACATGGAGFVGGIGCVCGGDVGGGDVDGGDVVEGAVVVAGTVVVVVGGTVVVVAGRVDDGAEDTVVLTTGSGPADFFDDDAPAIPPIKINSASGAAIFAHNGHDRTRAIGVVDVRVSTRSTRGCRWVGGPETGGTACVAAEAAPGGYHLPSDACHQPGSSGRSSSGPRSSSVTTCPRHRYAHRPHRTNGSRDTSVVRTHFQRSWNTRLERLHDE
jgi:hypothetical protein